MVKKQKNHRISILDAAQGSVLSKGFAATRIDEVCSIARVTKGSFYHHFESKDALAEALIDHYFQEVARAFSSGAWKLEKDPKVRLIGFLTNAVKVAGGPLLQRGCLLGSFALDLSQTHPNIQSEVDTRFGALSQLLKPLIQDATDKKITPKPPSAMLLAQQFVAVLQGAVILAKSSGDQSKAAMSVRCYKKMLEATLQL